MFKKIILLSTLTPFIIHTNEISRDFIAGLGKGVIDVPATPVVIAMNICFTPLVLNNALDYLDS